MRLSPKEKKAIEDSFANILKISYQLYLFGSRTNDKKKGGDIDLLVIVETEKEKANLVSLKSQIRSNIYQRIPEQRIDITVATSLEGKTETFLIEALQNAIRLSKV